MAKMMAAVGNAQPRQRERSTLQEQHAKARIGYSMLCQLRALPIYIILGHRMPQGAAGALIGWHGSGRWLPRCQWISERRWLSRSGNLGRQSFGVCSSVIPYVSIICHGAFGRVKLRLMLGVAGDRTVIGIFAEAVSNTRRILRLLLCHRVWVLSRNETIGRLIRCLVNATLITTLDLQQEVHLSRPSFNNRKTSWRKDRTIGIEAGIRAFATRRSCFLDNNNHELLPTRRQDREPYPVLAGNRVWLK